MPARRPQRPGTSTIGLGLPRIWRDLAARVPLPKLRVAGSNPVSRSRFSEGFRHLAGPLGRFWHLQIAVRPRCLGAPGDHYGATVYSIVQPQTFMAGQATPMNSSSTR